MVRVVCVAVSSGGNTDGLRSPGETEQPCPAADSQLQLCPCRGALPGMPTGIAASPGVTQLQQTHTLAREQRGYYKGRWSRGGVVWECEPRGGREVRTSCRRMGMDECARANGGDQACTEGRWRRCSLMRMAALRLRCWVSDVGFQVWEGRRSDAHQAAAVSGALPASALAGASVPLLAAAAPLLAAFLTGACCVCFTTSSSCSRAAGGRAVVAGGQVSVSAAASPTNAAAALLAGPQGHTHDARVHQATPAPLAQRLLVSSHRVSFVGLPGHPHHKAADRHVASEARGGWMTSRG